MSRSRSSVVERAAFAAPLFAFFSLAGMIACDPDDSPSTDSKSNWYQVCSSSEECDSDLACLCGVCSNSCSMDEDCDQERSSRCLDPEAYAECPTSPGAKRTCVATCEAADDCQAGQICLRSVCVTEGIPTSEACTDTIDWSDDDTAFEVSILDAINRQRATGTECDNASFQANEALTLDFRLRCAARNHSAEMVELGYFDEVSPDGTTPDQRMNAAGYDFSAWGIVIAQGTTQTSIDNVFGTYCQWFSNPDYSNVAVGASGSTWSLYFARP